MGKTWRRDRKNKHRKPKIGEDGQPVETKSRNDPAKYGQERDPYKLCEGGNFKMEVYYAYQGLHQDYLNEETGTYHKCTTDEEREAERQRWLTSLKSILPASFRIGNDVDPKLREQLEKELEQSVGQEMEITMEPKGGDRLSKELELKPEIKKIAPAKKLQFIPHGYQLNLDRQTLRRNTQLGSFHEWLKVQTHAGFITRQETVSMLPPVVLGCKPHHKVLDMCAAPGSKTSQLLEIVNLPAQPHDPEPTGLVVANDSDVKRAYMLVHQLRRINSPAVFISSCDAQFFPLIRDDKHPTEGIFDRVLCDVPCSGDGTTRKNPGIWKKWNQLNAFGLHALQLAIALKGVRLTKVGGYFCYSTCSMNPIENESVVAAILRASEGSLELVERRGDMEGLLARPGLATWSILCEDRSRRQENNIKKKNSDKMKTKRKEYEQGKKATSGEATTAEGDVTPMETEETSVPAKVEETETTATDENGGDTTKVTKEARFEPKSFDKAELKAMAESKGLKEYMSVEEVPESLRTRIRASCFPPTAEEAARFKMERCLRVLPQDMNTGAFFVALFKKVAPINPRAKARFDKLAEELQNKEGDEEADDDDEAIKSPIVKKARIETNGVASGDKTTTTLVDGEADGEKLPRGQGKQNFLVDANGNKHPTLGKDDFATIPPGVFDPLIEFYGLSSDSFRKDKYMGRACGEAKVLYFLSDSIKKLIDDGMQQRLTVVNSGLKGFERNNKECEVRYRLAQEGIHFVAPHMTKRKIYADVEDFRKFLETGMIRLDSFSDEVAAQIRPLSMGSFVVCLKGYEDDYIKKLLVVMWKCRGEAVSTMVNQNEMDGMKSKLRSVMGEMSTIMSVLSTPAEESVNGGDDNDDDSE
jgi:16S rRNA C967 or C1407 C5-methylase (RsmB/RsmF family)